MMHDWVSTHRATEPPPYEDKQKWGKDTVMTPYMPDYAERDLPRGWTTTTGVSDA